MTKKRKQYHLNLNAKWCSCGNPAVKLMQLARKLNWRFRIRVKVSVLVYQAAHSRHTVRALLRPPGQARFFHHIWLTEQHFGPLHLALADVQTPQDYRQ